MVTINCENSTTKIGSVYRQESGAFKIDEMQQKATKKLYLRHIVYYNT